MSDIVVSPGNSVSTNAVAFGAEGQPSTFVTPAAPLPVATYDAQGNPIVPEGGNVVDSNTTFTPLGAGETFTGEWYTDKNPQVGYSFEADQTGELFLDFSRDGGLTFATVRRYEVIGGEVGRFDALVKGAGRSFRLRFVNNGVAQTYLQVMSFTGTGLFPFAKSPRDLPVPVITFATVPSGTTIHEILVDLDDKTNYPHNDTGHLDVYGTGFSVDKPNNAIGVVQIGVITRIDATDAEIHFIQGVSFNTASDRQILRDRNYEFPFRLGQENGKLTSFLTRAVELNVPEVNTSTPLNGTAGVLATPAVGDLIVRFRSTTGGDFTSFVTIQYAGSASQT